MNLRILHRQLRLLGISSVRCGVRCCWLMSVPVKVTTANMGCFVLRVVFLPIFCSHSDQGPHSPSSELLQSLL